MTAKALTSEEITNRLFMKKGEKILILADEKCNWEIMSQIADRAHKKNIQISFDTKGRKKTMKFDRVYAL